MGGGHLCQGKPEIEVRQAKPAIKTDLDEEEEEELLPEEETNEEEEEDDFDEDKLTEESYRTTYDTDPNDLEYEAEEISDDTDF